MNRTNKGLQDLRNKYWPHEIEDRQLAYEEYLRRLDNIGDGDDVSA